MQFEFEVREAALTCNVLQIRYPTNPILRMITPQDTVRPLDVYPVKLTQDAIMVDVSGAATTKFQTSRGGSDSSIDANNVFAIQPRVYIEGTDPDGRTQFSLWPIAENRTTQVWQWWRCNVQYM